MPLLKFHGWLQWESFLGWHSASCQPKTLWEMDLAGWHMAKDEALLCVLFPVWSGGANICTKLLIAKTKTATTEFARYFAHSLLRDVALFVRFGFPASDCAMLAETLQVPSARMGLVVITVQLLAKAPSDSHFLIESWDLLRQKCMLMFVLWHEHRSLTEICQFRTWLYQLANLMRQVQTNSHMTILCSIMTQHQPISQSSETGGPQGQKMTIWSMMNLWWMMNELKLSGAQPSPCLDVSGVKPTESVGPRNGVAAPNHPLKTHLHATQVPHIELLGLSWKAISLADPHDTTVLRTPTWYLRFEDPGSESWQEGNIKHLGNPLAILLPFDQWVKLTVSANNTSPICWDDSRNCPYTCLTRILKLQVILST